MNDGKLTIDLSGVGNDIPTKLGKSRPTLTCSSAPLASIAITVVISSLLWYLLNEFALRRFVSRDN